MSTYSPIFDNGDRVERLLPYLPANGGAPRWITQRGTVVRQPGRVVLIAWDSERLTLGARAAEVRAVDPAQLAAERAERAERGAAIGDAVTMRVGIRPYVGVVLESRPTETGEWEHRCHWYGLDLESWRLTSDLGSADEI